MFKRVMACLVMALFCIPAYDHQIPKRCAGDIIKVPGCKSLAGL